MTAKSEKTKSIGTQRQAILTVLKNKRRLTAILKECTSKELENIQNNALSVCEEIENKRKEDELKKSKITNSLNQQIDEYRKQGYSDSEIKEALTSLIQ